MATIRKRGKGYQLRCSAGYDANGKQIVRTKTWNPPSSWADKRAAKEAVHQAELFEEEVRRGLNPSGKIKFSQFIELWFEKYAEPTLKPRTVKRYKDFLIRVTPALGHIPLDSIQPIHLLNFYQSISDMEPASATYRASCDIKGQIKDSKITKAAFAEKSGVSQTTLSTVFRGGGVSKASAEKIAQCLGKDLLLLFVPTGSHPKLSNTTIQHYHRFLSSVFSTAVKWQYIPYNPCSRCCPPRSSEKPEIEYLDDVSARQLLLCLRSEPHIYQTAVTLLLLTGMRRGELCGLEWQDVDLNAKTLWIQRTSQYLPGRGVYTDTPKNRTSKRLIYLSNEAVSLLVTHYQWTQRQKRCIKEWGTNRIIVTEEGRPMLPDSLTHWFSKFIRRHPELPQIHIHSLRHTYASLAIAKGVPLTAVAAQLGHASVSTTANIYAHAIKAAQIAAADRVGGLFTDVFQND